MADEKRCVRIDNFAFVNSETKLELVHPDKYRGLYSIVGLADYREGIGENKFICSSPVKNLSVKERKAYTEGKSLYLLGTESEYYADFKTAIAEKVPVLIGWSLQGTMDHKYLIDGFIGDEHVHDYVYAHDEKNFIILDDGRRVFVMWTYPSEETIMELVEGHVADMTVENDFEEVLGLKARPGKLYP